MNDNTTQTEKETSKTVTSNSKRRSWIWYTLGGMILIAVVLAGVIFLPGYGAPTMVTEANPINFAEVVITDLIQEETYNGVVGYVEDDPVKTMLGGIITELPEAGETINQGEALFAIDNEPVILLYGELPAYRDIAIGSEVQSVSNSSNGTLTWVAKPGAILQQGDELYRADNRPVIVLYGEQPAYRDLSMIGDQSVTIAGQLNGTITWVAEPGAVIEQGDVLFRVDDRPVVMLYGEDPAYRNMYGGYDVRSGEGNNTTIETITLEGEDIFQLEEALIALGYDPNGVVTVDGEFDSDTLQMVGRWQKDIGAKTDGVVHFGEVVFLPGPAQVLDILSAPGDYAIGDVINVATGAPTTGADVRQLQEGLIALGYDADGALAADGTFTPETTQAVLDFQGAAGLETDGVLDFGEVVFLPGPSQVIDHLAAPGDAAGGLVASIASGDPTSGGDILQLEQALIALGYDADGALVADGTYTLETYQAVLAFQAGTGLEPDGVLDLGEIIFLPGAVRVTGKFTTKNSHVSPDTPVLRISLSENVIYMALPADDQGALAVGNAVTVEMPDNILAPATVVFVSQTATPGQNEWDPAWFEVRIELDDPSLAAGLDEAPVDVIIISDSVSDVMSIPVAALVALLEGGYAVEVDTGNGQMQLIAVEVGFFGNNNMIEITSDALEPGDRVVVP